MIVGGIGPGAGATTAEACLLPVLRSAPGTLTYCVTVSTSYVFEGCDGVNCQVNGFAEIQASGPAGGSGRAVLNWNGGNAISNCSWGLLGTASCRTTAEGRLRWAQADGCRRWSITAQGHVTPIVTVSTLPVEGVMRASLFESITTCPSGVIT